MAAIVFLVVMVIVGLSVPQRISFSDAGVEVRTFFCRNRSLDHPHEKHWWGRSFRWEDVRRARVRQNSGHQSFVLGSTRLVIQLGVLNSFEIHARDPIYASAVELCERHMGDRMKDTSRARWRFLQ